MKARDDMFSEFENPPSSYGEVAFYWWVGEPLTKERLSWQLEQLKDHHICALQINYCHGNKGGQSFGLTMDSDPPLFSDDWWELVGWFVEQCKNEGICVSLSDYTLGIGQGWYMDEILREYPDICGQYLELENGQVVVKTKENSVNPLDKRLGPAVIEYFFGVFEKHFPGECGKALNFFFSDELSFQVRGKLWHPTFPDEFKKRKGYDIIPYLKGLFEDIGDITQKIRLDYYDVMVQMEEEAYFIPVYQWHEERGMTYGCDHGGRGRDITEFGDYFRTQRWNQGPGNDQPRLASDIIKNKVASSIAHLYNRPRTWLEGYYGSGWGTSSSDIIDATFRNFCMGHNLLTLHGLYYTTYGSMWEWAPPCNHFRMPYWKHMDRFLLCTKRLSYLMSQGIHVADAAILYPVAAVEGGIDGEAAVRCSFEVAEQLYDNGIDFDFMDFESLDRAAVIVDGEGACRLQVSAKDYRVLILPSMKTIRYSSLKKAAEFSRKGGVVLFVGNLPVASDRAGRNDAVLEKLVAEILARTAPAADSLLLPARIRHQIMTDFFCSNLLYQGGTERDKQELANGLHCRSGYFQHRTIEGKEVYFLYGIEKGSECRIRAIGETTILNPWTARSSSFYVQAVEETGGMHFAYPLEKEEMLILVVNPEMQPTIQKSEELVKQQAIALCEEWECEIIPTMDNSFGDFVQPPSKGCLGPRCMRDINHRKMGYEYHFQMYGPLPEQLQAEIGQLNGQPVTVGKKKYTARPYGYSLRYGIENDPGNQDSYHGNKGKISDEFLCMGKKVITYANSCSEYRPEEGGKWYYFVTYVMLTEETSVWIREGSMKANRIWINGRAADVRMDGMQAHPAVQKEMAGNDVTGKDLAGSDVIENDVIENDVTGKVTLPAGISRIVLEYASSGRTYFVLDRVMEAEPVKYPLASRWYQNHTILSFMDSPESWKRPCLFQTMTPPGVRRILIRAAETPEVYLNGEAEKVQWVEDNLFCCDVSAKNIMRETQLQIVVNGNEVKYGFDCLESIAYQCGTGIIRAGDWGEMEGLWGYSGGICYHQRFTLQTVKKTDRIICDLGEVGCSVALQVNGKSAGIRMSQPYLYDITDLVHDGENFLKAEVYNSLHNHYRTVPNYYNERVQKSGIIGPVRLLRLSSDASEERKEMPA